MSSGPARSVQFVLGCTVMTPGVLAALANEDVSVAISRHARGDWGDVCEEDWKANDDALRVSSRLFSTYHTADGRKFWIITEADRSVTTVLLPEEY